MKTVGLLMLVSLISSIGFCQVDTTNLDLANKAYDKGQKEKAKSLYLKAAATGNAAAHFALYFKYNLPPEQRFSHLASAAKTGNKDAVANLFNDLVFSANSLTIANPALAYEIYLEALKNNPQLDFYDMKNQVATIKKCIEAEPFDVLAFMKKYNLTADSLKGAYTIWELAAEAMKGGRFGKPDAKLAFQLVCRGGSAPGELEAAVDAAYINWKENRFAEFNFCGFATSEIGMSYCAHRKAEIAEVSRRHRITLLLPKLKNKSGPLLEHAYESASRFFVTKATLEEGHAFNGKSYDMAESITKQKDEFIDLIERINNDSVPQPFITDEHSNVKLNEAYQAALAQVDKNSKPNPLGKMGTGNVSGSQDAWYQYQDSTAELLARIMPSISEDKWASWLAHIRIKQLQSIANMK